MKYLLIIAILSFIFYNSAHSQCQECEKELKKVQQDIDNLNRSLEDCKKNQKKVAPTKVEGFSATIEKLNEKNEQLKAQSDSLSNKLKFYIDLNTDCKNNLNISQNQLNVCNLSLNALNQRISYLQDTISALTLRLIDFEKLSPEERSNKKRIRIEKDIQKLNISLSEKKNELESTSRMLKNTENEYKEITSEIESQNLVFKSINEDIRKLQIEKDHIAGVVSTYKEDKYLRERELNNVITNINQENTTLNNLKNDISNKESKLSSLKNEISKTESRLSDLESNLPTHFTLGLALSSNWNYGLLDEKYAKFDINSWNGRAYIGYCLDFSNKRWDRRDRATVIGVFLNYGANSKDNLKNILLEQKVDTLGFNSNHINQFYEIECGLVISEILQLSLGYGNQGYEIIQNNQNVLNNLDYFDLTLGLQAPLYEYLDIGLSSTFQYGIDYQKVSARFGLYTTFKLNFYRW